MTGICLQGDLCMGDTALIRDLALDMPAGRWSCLLGPSGVGKSSIARLLAELPGPQHLRGQLTTGDGQPLAGRVALMAQEGQLLPWADLVANVTISARLRGQAADRAQARALLAEVGLAGMEGRRPAELSGGQRQRVALARVLSEAAPVVLLDEPFSALDTITRLAMQDLAARLLKGRTILLITHDPLEALRLSDRAWLLGRNGAEALPLPDTPAPRDYRAPDLLRAQAALLARLHGELPCAG